MVLFVIIVSFTIYRMRITVCMSITDLVSLRNAESRFTSVLVVAVVAAEFENSGLLGLY